jgi:hypothetical protein
MGRRNADGFEEFGHETGKISGGLEKLFVLCNLIWTMLAHDEGMENTETNLIEPDRQFFQCNRGTPCISKNTEDLQPCEEFRLQESA